MPEECASMRSIARWVLPVLVGPSTAVTPTPRARASRLWGAEKETAISDERPVSVEVCTTMRRQSGSFLTDRTSLERIAAESLTRPVSEFVHPDIWRLHGSTPLEQVTFRNLAWPAEREGLTRRTIIVSEGSQLSGRLSRKAGACSDCREHAQNSSVAQFSEPNRRPLPDPA